jgi:hypothetical protein
MRKNKTAVEDAGTSKLNIIYIGFTCYVKPSVVNFVVNNGKVHPLINKRFVHSPWQNRKIFQVTSGL